MRTCPNSHPVHDHLEYCQFCGSWAGYVVIPAQASAAETQLWACSHCRTSQGVSRYCEACGEPNPAHPEYANEPTDQLQQQVREPVAPPAQITIVAIADRVFFDRMQSNEGPDAATLAFPTIYPPRAFTLDNQQIFIGRRSRSRGIEPDIDLSAAPEDSGVSHAHAAIVQADGHWTLVDVGSSNGTFLNDATEPLAANTPVFLNDGDEVHLGAWTTLKIGLT